MQHATNIRNVYHDLRGRFNCKYLQSCDFECEIKHMFSSHRLLEYFFLFIDFSTPVISQSDVLSDACVFHSYSIKHSMVAITTSSPAFTLR